MKKNIVDKIPTEDTTLTIIYSAKVLFRTIGVGASFGKEFPEVDINDQ